MNKKKCRKCGRKDVYSIDNFPVKCADIKTGRVTYICSVCAYKPKIYARPVIRRNNEKGLRKMLDRFFGITPTRQGRRYGKKGKKRKTGQSS